MKTIVKLTTILVLFIATKVVAQTPPTTPKTPETSTVTSSTESISSYSGDDSEEYSSSSVSVKSTNSLYKFRASFADKKTANIKQRIQKELSKMKNITTTNSNRWSYFKNDEKVFECKLSEGHLRLFLDKELSSKKMETKIIALGEELKHFISNGSSAKVTKTNLDHAKRELERAEKAYKRAQQNYKKAKQN